MSRVGKVLQTPDHYSLKALLLALFTEEWQQGIVMEGPSCKGGTHATCMNACKRRGSQGRSVLNIQIARLCGGLMPHVLHPEGGPTLPER